MSKAAGPPPLPGPRQSRKAVLSFAIGGFLLLLIGIPIALYTAARVRDRDAIRRLEADIRKKGEPLTLKELAATYPPIPDEQNAAVVLLNLWEKEDPAFWSAFRKNIRPLPTPTPPSYDPELPFLGKKWRRPKNGQRLGSDSLKAADAFFQERREHIETIRSALERPRCRFPINLEDGLNALIPHLFQFTREVQTLRIAVLCAAERGDRDKAISALQDMVGLSGTLSDEPLQISQITRLSCLQIAISSLEDLLCRQRLTDAETGRLEEILKATNPRASLRRSLVCERTMALSVFDLPDAAVKRIAESDTENQDPTQYAANYRRGIRILSATGFSLPDRRLILETMAEAVELAEETPPVAWRHAQRLEASLWEKMGGFPPKLYSPIVISGGEGMIRRFNKFEAQKRAALVALAIERYRQGHAGNLPEKLDSLVPQFLDAIPKDPFDGKPLRYRRSDGGYAVYSVGPNLRDDGGERTYSVGQPDEVFAVLRSDK